MADNNSRAKQLATQRRKETALEILEKIKRTIEEGELDVFQYDEDEALGNLTFKYKCVVKFRETTS